MKAALGSTGAAVAAGADHVVEPGGQQLGVATQLVVDEPCPRKLAGLVIRHTIGAVDGEAIHPTEEVDSVNFGVQLHLDVLGLNCHTRGIFDLKQVLNRLEYRLFHRVVILKGDILGPAKHPRTEVTQQLASAFECSLLGSKSVQAFDNVVRHIATG